MDLDKVALSEIGQAQKDKHHTTSPLCVTYNSHIEVERLLLSEAYKVY